MTVDVGDRLDKYELIERVGQGGMAIVYRGIDTSLRREVAIKVLHHHLADSQEARDRFEREAHAVAKLHHENILEIFDFSGGDSDSSYIVTEFIDGQTLKQFITAHEIAFPEVGAMIAVQVCRALGHAHSLGVLHRDVKPENIMIRRDGVVKLTDFGIAQMVDLQRMTVTGQLLGSPAYMSPEHVEGKGLDFRTDVFAVGIVLYQLITGELPFKGRNPHEILKRIAECRFIDPQVVNPRVGTELARIVRRSLAREKEDRYADVSEMLTALEAFLAGCELTDHRAELGAFFADPAAYEAALRPRLLATLATRGQTTLDAGNEVAALELFNRALTIDPKHKGVLGVLDRLGKRRRMSRIGLLFACLLAVGAAGAAVKLWLGASEDRVPVIADDDPAQRADASRRVAVATEPGRADAGARASQTPTPPIDAGGRRGEVDPGDDRADARPRDRKRPDAGTIVRSMPPDAAVPAVTTTRVYTLHLSPRGSQYRIDDGGWSSIGASARITLPTRGVTITARNSICCAEAKRTIKAGDADGEISLTLPFLPASITPRCDKPGIGVKIDGQAARLGKPRPIPLDDTMGSKRVSVLFFGDDVYDQQEVEVRYKQDKVVTCPD